MRKIIIISVLTISAMYATNGDNMIGLGTQARAMGGIGIGVYTGTDSVFRNPAWVVDEGGFNSTFGATFFMPKVHAKVGPMNGAGNGVSAKSKADFSIIPTVSFANRINDNLSYGVGMFGVSGMGVDYRNEDPNKGLANMRTLLQYMRFVPAISYKVDNLRIGVGLSMAYGALNMAAVTPNNPRDPRAGFAQRSGGTSEDIGFGGQLGLGYYLLPNLTLGAYYQTKVSTTYEGLFDFNNDGRYDDLKLSQPAEAGIGLGWTAECGCYKIGIDYRRIMWSDADGYDSFGWDDQDVFSIGGSYHVDDSLVLRAGYNYAKSPLHNKKFKSATVGGAPFNGFQVAYFNALGFPAYTDSHITAGLSYQISKSTGLDLAYVYAPKVTEKIAATQQTPALEASNEQNSLSVAIKYKF